MLSGANSSIDANFIVNIFIAIISVAALCVAVLAYLKQRNRKEITYEVISDTSVLSVKKEVKDKVKILFDGKDVSNSRLVILRIWNSGTVPIMDADFKENQPITFDFGEKAEILYAEIIETIPNSIKDNVTLKQDIEKLILEPSLLNVKESVKLKILLTKFDGKVNADARIVGGQIRNSEGKNLSLNIRTITIGAIISFISVNITVIIYLVFDRIMNFRLLSSLTITLLTLEALFFIILNRRKKLIDQLKDLLTRSKKNSFTNLVNLCSLNSSIHNILFYLYFLWFINRNSYIFT